MTGAPEMYAVGKSNTGSVSILPRDITQYTLTAMARLGESELATSPFHPPVAKHDGRINPLAKMTSCEAENNSG